MKKKANIVSVKELGGGKYLVTYESGVKRTYSKMTKTIAAYILRHKKPEQPVGYSSPYFKSLDAEVIFYLLQLDGEERAYRLNINKIHYGSETAAKRWRDDLMKIIHPDVCKHPLAGQAAAKVNQIYEGMVA